MMKSMKIKFNSDDELPLNKTIEIPRINIISKFSYMNAYMNYNNVKMF